MEACVWSLSVYVLVNKMTPYFLMLIMSCHIPEIFVFYRYFLWNYSPLMDIISSANRDDLTSLSISIHLISFPCLIALATDSSALLKRSRDSEHSCLILMGLLWDFSPFRMMLALRL